MRQAYTRGTHCRLVDSSHGILSRGPDFRLVDSFYPILSRGPACKDVLGICLPFCNSVVRSATRIPGLTTEEMSDANSGSGVSCDRHFLVPGCSGFPLALGRSTKDSVLPLTAGRTRGWPILEPSHFVTLRFRKVTAVPFLGCFLIAHSYFTPNSGPSPRTASLFWEDPGYQDQGLRE